MERSTKHKIEFLDRWIFPPNLKQIAPTGIRRFFVNDRLRVLSKFLKGVKPGSYVLDLGCGTGRYAFSLEKRYGYKVIGVDLLHHCISYAESFRRKSYITATFVVGDALELPFTDESFDAVFCSDVIGHVTDSLQLFTEINRVLRKDGVAAILAETDEYRRKPSTWAYHICKYLGLYPYVELDGHCNLKPARKLLQEILYSGLLVERLIYYPKDLMIFSFIRPRPEQELYEKFPALSELRLIQVTEAFVKIHNFLDKIRPLRFATTSFSLFLELVLEKILRNDYGGIYLKLVKIK